MDIDIGPQEASGSDSLLPNASANLRDVTSVPDIEMTDAPRLRGPRKGECISRDSHVEVSRRTRAVTGLHRLLYTVLA